jgi:MOSC domain-containing protein YiiM
MRHASSEELEAGLPLVRSAPSDEGSVRLIVRRPAPDEREVVAEARLTPEEGLVGDDWARRGSRGGSAPPARYAQLTMMNARVAELICGGSDPADWAAAGDQLFVDLDLSVAGLPPGTRLAVGEAVVEISAEPHTGCAKFSARFGPDAVRFANSPQGRALRLRGANASIVQAGVVRAGDCIRRL